MSVDHIRYDLLTKQAMRAVVRRVLQDVAKMGALPGEHHFYITFDTRAPGVKVSPRLREQYPEAMTIVLQHQFWDLTVTETHFDVGLSFNGVTEKLHVPFDAMQGFFDPSVQFGVQFETQGDVPEAEVEKPAEAAPRPGARRKPQAVDDAPAAIGPAEPVKPVAVAEAVEEKPEPAPDKPPGGAEVVRLDRFRKK